MEIEIQIDMVVERVVSQCYVVEAENHQQAIDDVMYRLRQGDLGEDPDSVVSTRVRALTVGTDHETVELFS